MEQDNRVEKQSEIQPAKVMFTLVPDLAETHRQHEREQMRTARNHPQFYGATPPPSPARVEFTANKNYVSKKPVIPLDSLDGISKQIGYYFSEENLLKDKYIKSQMDKNGFVDVNVIAMFPRMKQNRISSQTILSCAQEYDLIQVVGRFLRATGIWWRFVANPAPEQPEVTEDNSTPEQMAPAFSNEVADDDRHNEMQASFFLEMEQLEPAISRATSPQMEYAGPPNYYPGYVYAQPHGMDYYGNNDYSLYNAYLQYGQPGAVFDESGQMTAPYEFGFGGGYPLRGRGRGGRRSFRGKRRGRRRGRFTGQSVGSERETDGEPRGREGGAEMAFEERGPEKSSWREDDEERRDGDEEVAELLKDFENTTFGANERDD